VIIANHTRFATRPLRRLICAVHSQLARFEGRLPTWDDLLVEVREARVHGYGGDAALDGTDVILWLPRPARVRRVAYLIDHELLHLHGYRHQRMSSHAKAWRPAAVARFAWAEGLIGARWMPRR
jgi:hypothetical protein